MTGEEKMNRKDYQLIAEALRIANGSITVAPYDAETAISLVIHLLADRLEKENSRFDRDRFTSACLGVSVKDISLVRN